MALTQEYLKTILDYDKDSGNFIWLENRANNQVKKESIAGNISKHDGYIQIGINKKVYRAHKLVWLYSYGSIPKVLDHINGIRDDNRLENLRISNYRKNSQNKNIHRKGKLFGCYYDTNSSKYRARIKLNGKNIHLGMYFTELQAHEAYLAAEWLINEVIKL